MFNFFNKKNGVPQQESFRSRDPQGFKALRDRILRSPISFEKKHLLEDEQELDRLTEHVGRSLTMGGEMIDEEVLSSPQFMDVLTRALQIEPTKEIYMTTNAQGDIVGTADSKTGIIEKVREERERTSPNNQ